MPRIRTDQPSSGKSTLVLIPATTNGGFVNTSWTTIAEAPDFSIPNTGGSGIVPDPSDVNRELRPGEVFIETQLLVTNVTGSTSWVQIQIKLEGTSGQEIPLSTQVPVAGGQTIILDGRGIVLLKTNLTNTEPGGRLQIRAQTNNALIVAGAATEREAPQHAPDTE